MVLQIMEPYDNDFAANCVAEAKMMIDGITDRFDRLLCILEDLNIRNLDIAKYRGQVSEITDRLFQRIQEEVDRVEFSEFDVDMDDDEEYDEFDL